MAEHAASGTFEKRKYEFLVKNYGGQEAVDVAYCLERIRGDAERKATIGETLGEAEKDGWVEQLRKMRWQDIVDALAPAVQTGGKKSRSRRDASSGQVEKILAAIREHPKSRARDIASYVGLSPADVASYLKMMRARKLVKCEGERAQMKYSVEPSQGSSGQESSKGPKK